jgi:hypothetical protein
VEWVLKDEKCVNRKNKDDILVSVGKSNLDEGG